MLRRTEGIVLKTFPLGEADLIVSFLTPDHGLISAFAKSPRKTKSRFGSSLEPFTYSNISFWGKEDSKLPRLTQADIIEPFQELREDIATFTAASEAALFTLRLLAEGEANKKAFYLLRGVLRMMLRPSDRSFVIVLYKIRLLDIAGYSPSLKGCARCGKTGYGFYTPDGSIICDSCIGGAATRGLRGATPHHIRLSPGCVKLYESLRTWDMEKVFRIKPSLGMMKELQSLLGAHVEYLHPEKR
ncbi:MAG: DNA repair protein RecO [Thermodesulfovibrionales bacterium]|nr:DNA repair protein RecO [Thermodesulfovibrionales bacterium]